MTNLYHIKQNITFMFRWNADGTVPFIYTTPLKVSDVSQSTDTKNKEEKI
jgi:hypothetical protein